MPNATATPNLTGALGAFALADVLQLLDLGARTGVLEVDGGPLGGGAVALRRGRVLAVSVVPTAATTDDAADRLATLMSLAVGHWAFYPDAGATDRAAADGPGIRVGDLLLEAACRQDERAARRRRSSSVPAAAAGDASAALGTGKLTGAELAVLAAVDGSRDLDAIAAAVRRDPEHVRGALDILRTLGLVHPGDVGPTA